MHNIFGWKEKEKHRKQQRRMAAPIIPVSVQVGGAESAVTSRRRIVMQWGRGGGRRCARVAREGGFRDKAIMLQRKERIRLSK